MNKIILLIIGLFLFFYLFNYNKENFINKKIPIWCNKNYLMDKSLIYLNYPKNNKIYIPKYIHQTYLDWESVPYCCKQIIKHNLKINPQYKYKFYSNKDLNNFVNTYCSIKEKEVFLNINPIYGSCVSDFARYLIIYYLGGVYLDIKAKINKNLDDIIQRDTLILSSDNICIENKYDNFINNKKCIGQWLLIYPAYHPLIKNVINEVISNFNDKKKLNEIQNLNIKDNRQKVWLVTGPIAYSKAINKDLHKYKYIKLPKLGWYSESYWQLDNFIIYDGTNGKYYNNVKKKHTHYSQFDKKFSLTIN